MKHLLLLLVTLAITTTGHAGTEIAMITASKHFDTKHDYNENNPGGYVVHRKYIVGAYKNSYSTPTIFAGRVASATRGRVRLSLAYGLSYGYGWSNGYADPADGGARLLPFILPTLSVGSVNFHIVGNAAAISFTIKR